MEDGQGKLGLKGGGPAGDEAGVGPSAELQAVCREFVPPGWGQDDEDDEPDVVAFAAAFAALVWPLPPLEVILPQSDSPAAAVIAASRRCQTRRRAASELAGEQTFWPIGQVGGSEAAKKRARTAGDGEGEGVASGAGGEKRAAAAPKKRARTVTEEAHEKSEPDAGLVNEVRVYMKANKLSQVMVGQEARVSQAVLSQWLSLMYHGHNAQVDSLMREWLNARRSGTSSLLEDELTSVLRPSRSTTTSIDSMAE
jgi:hypothetical protein